VLYFTLIGSAARKLATSELNTLKTKFMDWQCFGRHCWWCYSRRAKNEVYAAARCFVDPPLLGWGVVAATISGCLRSQPSRSRSSLRVT